MRDLKLGSVIILLLLAGFTLLFPDRVSAAEEGGDKWGILLTIGRLFNLALVAGIVVWLARKPLAEFFVSRTQSIHEQITEAEKVRRESEAKLAEIQSRMSHLDEELKALKESAEKEAQAEYQRLIGEAERDAQKIIDRARQEIDGMTRAAHIELKAHAGELSVQLAEEIIRREITDEDRGRIFARFVTRLGVRQ
jgi:F-type H+-transporting ATPase subunit b